MTLHSVHRRSIALFTASLAVGVTLPLATTHALYSYEQTTVTGQDGREVQLHRSYTARDRRDYRRAMEIYDQYVQQGVQDLVKPNINDRATIDIYLENPTGPDRDKSDEISNPVSIKGYTAPTQEKLSTATLTKQERAALQRSLKLGRCWNFQNFSPGFMEICLQFIKGKETSRTTGFETDLKALRGKLNKSSSSRARASASSAPRNYRDEGRIVPRGKSGGRDEGRGYSATRVLPY